MSFEEQDPFAPEELTPRAILRGMLAVWDYDRNRWTQEALSRSKDGATVQARDPKATSWCAAGAAVRGSCWCDESLAQFSAFQAVLQEALGLWARELQEILRARLGYVLAADNPLPIFLNDHGETTFDDVLLAAKRALDATYEESGA